MLYRVASVIVYGVEDEPHLRWKVWLQSDQVRLGGRPIETGQVPISRPTTQSPRAWLRECLEQFPEQ